MAARASIRCLTVSSSAFRWSTSVRGHAEFRGDPVNCPRLIHGAWHSVEDIVAAGRYHIAERLVDCVAQDLVRHQFPAVEVIAHDAAGIGAPIDVITQNFTRADVGDVEVGGDQRTLRSLAGARRCDHSDSHALVPLLFVRKLSDAVKARSGLTCQASVLMPNV